MPETKWLNAVLLAGDRRGSIQVCHENKAFLLLRGVPLFIHVLRALQESEEIKNVVIVGPSDRLQLALEQHGTGQHDQHRVLIVEQRDNMIENFKAGFLASLGLPDVSFQSLRGSEYAETPVLVAPCDIPLLTPDEVDEYIQGSNLHEYDYSIGVTSEKVLSYFHPQKDRPGIRMIYFHVREGLMRHNNLHIGKPLKFDHLDYIEKMYEWRYQTRLRNMLRMLFSLLFTSWRLFKGVRMFILMQVSLHYDRHGHPHLSDRIRSMAGFNRLAEGIGNAIGARVQIVYTHFGGAALDADHDKDLAAIEARYDDWMDHQRKPFR